MPSLCYYLKASSNCNSYGLRSSRATAAELKVKQQPQHGQDDCTALPSKPFVLKFNLRSAKKFFEKSSADGAEPDPKLPKTPGAKGAAKPKKGDEDAGQPASKRRRRKDAA